MFYKSTAKVNPACFVHVSAEAPNSQCTVLRSTLLSGIVAVPRRMGQESMFLVSVDFGIILF
jgi:hypothetical protein